MQYITINMYIIIGKYKPECVKIEINSEYYNYNLVYDN